MQNDELRRHTEQANMNRPMIDGDRPASRSYVGVMVGLAVAIAVGLMLWGFADNNRVASDKAPGTTTGSSTTAPSPSNPPPAKGAGESNSTR
jgi:hypothetical protein